MKGVFAVHCVDFGLPERYRVVFYRSVFEMVLMQFLYYVQAEEIPVFCGVSESSVLEFMDMCDDYLGSIETHSIFGAAVFFKKCAGTRLLDGFSEAAGNCVAATEDLNARQYKILMETRAQCVKKVLVNTEGMGTVPSYCTVEAPLAYLLRTEQDCNKCPEKWPSSGILSSIISLLSGSVYSSMADFKMAVAGLAGTVGLAGTCLFDVVQSLMIAELIQSKTLDVCQPFSIVLSELLGTIKERGLQKDDYQRLGL